MPHQTKLPDSAVLPLDHSDSRIKGRDVTPQDVVELGWVPGPEALLTCEPGGQLLKGRDQLCRAKWMLEWGQNRPMGWWITPQGGQGGNEARREAWSLDR